LRRKNSRQAPKVPELKKHKQSMQYHYLLNIVLRVFIGFMLVKGGIAKFSKPLPEPNQMIEKVKAGEVIAADEAELKIRNYVFGLKQSGYFWQVLGVAEILGGVLLLSQVLGLLGAIVSFPMLLHIFLFHLFLEPDDVGDLIKTGLMLVGAIWLIAFEYKKFLPILKTNWWASKTQAEHV